MYIRWKKRVRTKHKKPTGDYALTAVLVESVRGYYEAGQQDSTPRQRIICYLGTIRQSTLQRPYFQMDFWISADAHLDKVQLTPEQRATIEARLAEVVSRPTPELFQQAAQQLAEIEARMGRHV